MIFGYILVEGQTEETFARDVLIPHFIPKSIGLKPILLTTRPARHGQPAHRGGISRFKKVEADIRAVLRDSSVHCVTTLIDFYGLGSTFPGWSEMPTGSCFERVNPLEAKIAEHIADPRFIPYFALHEYEAILFAAPEEIAAKIPGWTRGRSAS